MINIMSRIINGKEKKKIISADVKYTLLRKRRSNRRRMRRWTRRRRTALISP